MKWMTVKEWVMTLPKSMRDEILPKKPCKHNFLCSCKLNSDMFKVKVNRLSKALDLIGFLFTNFDSDADYWWSFTVCLMWAEGSSRFIGEGKWR